MFSKENIYRNSYFIYRMNQKLEFPLRVLTDALKNLTSREDVILRVYSGLCRQ